MPKKVQFKKSKVIKKAAKKSLKSVKVKSKPKTKIPPQVAKYLEKTGVSHEILEHRTVYTAMDAAMTLKKKLDEIAKSLLVMADKDYYLIVLPSDKNIDLEKLKKVLIKETKRDIKVVKIPSEKVMEEFIKIKQGKVSAFGKVYNVPVIMEKSFDKVKKAVFPSGSFNHSVEMLVKDFVKLENAMLGTFGVPKKIKLQSAKNAKGKKKPKNKN